MVFLSEGSVTLRCCALALRSCATALAPRLPRFGWLQLRRGSFKLLGAAPRGIIPFKMGFFTLSNGFFLRIPINRCALALPSPRLDTVRRVFTKLFFAFPEDYLPLPEHLK